MPLWYSSTPTLQSTVIRSILEQSPCPRFNSNTSALNTPQNKVFYVLLKSGTASFPRTFQFLVHWHYEEEITFLIFWLPTTSRSLWQVFSFKDWTCHRDRLVLVVLKLTIPINIRKGISIIFTSSKRTTAEFPFLTPGNKVLWTSDSVIRSFWFNWKLPTITSAQEKLKLHVIWASRVRCQKDVFLPISIFTLRKKCCNGEFLHMRTHTHSVGPFKIYI